MNCLPRRGPLAMTALELGIHDEEAQALAVRGDPGGLERDGQLGPGQVMPALEGPGHDIGRPGQVDASSPVFR